MLVYQPVYQPDALEDPGELEDPPSLGCFGQKLTCLGVEIFINDIIVIHSTCAIVHLQC